MRFNITINMEFSLDTFLPGRYLFYWLFLITVGCDGIIGSGAVEDQCGICNGDGKTCRVIAGIFTRVYLPHGYNLITRIPAGACKINITEMARSRNYLALKVTNGSYAVNGHRHRSRHGDYSVAGTSFTYSRGHGNGCPGSCLYTEGPTTQSVDIELLFYGRNRGIKYQFTIPANLTDYFMKHMVPKTSYSQYYNNQSARYRPTADTRTNQNARHLNIGKYPQYVPPRTNQQVQSLSTTSNRHRSQSNRQNVQHGSQYYNSQYYRTNQRNRYGQNSAAQGDYGIRYNSQQQSNNRIIGNRQSTLQNNNNVNNGRPYINDAIDPIRSPPLSAQASPDRVHFYWRISGFTECSLTCGGGVQMTKVICMKRNTNVIVTQENCDPRDKPSTQTLTCNTKPCPPSWTKGNWSDCSATCGEGMQTREVTCQQLVSRVPINVPVYRCVSEDRPISSRSCKNIPCAEWKIGEWGKCSANCGQGEKTRKVVCQNVDNVTVLDDQCEGLKPENTRRCDMGSCAQGWFYSKWSTECSSSCGKGYYTRKVYCSAPDGTQLSENKCSASKPRDKKSCQNDQPCASCGTGIKRRDVICMKKLGKLLFAVVNEENCEGKPKPKSEQPCDQLPPCPAEWFMTSWTQCSVSCGTGTKTREIKCLDSELQPSTSCDQSKRPSRRHTCNTQDCEQPQLDDQDPRCRDKFKLCKIVVQARLCRLPYYSKLCCDSCTKHKHHQQHRRKHTRRRQNH
ncbi:hypothetical protein KUTeg_017993 [Tegillarca granosa]|uniref:PLAC domain-containing protein n=1 Tax=Tegillarca granosa TaxID=220873 RepID=A0ABQ9ELW0_TEGGR|nr:hypothetical protein KUTeg_017993 [Tegillarca granosa]